MSQDAESPFAPVPENPYAAPLARGESIDMARVTAKVQGPAVGLMITAGLGIVLQLFGLIGNAAGLFLQEMQLVPADQGPGAPTPLPPALLLSIVIGCAALTILVSILIFLGARKMQSLQSYGWAMTSAILAMLPCLSPCCVIGLPMGVWALVVLMSPGVKASFR